MRFALFTRALLTPAVLACLAGTAQTTPKIKVTTQADLPRMMYPIQGDAQQLFTSTPEAFLAVMEPVRADVDRILRDYDIEDHQTLRLLLEAKLDFDVLSGQNVAEAHSLIAQIRSYEDKPGSKLATDLMVEQYLDARTAQGGNVSSTGCPANFEDRYRAAVNALPWAVVRQDIMDERSLATLMTRSFLLGFAESHVGPSLAKTHTLSFSDALRVVFHRAQGDVMIACSQPTLAVLTQYIKKNDVAKPDIWAARKVDLSPAEKLHPVNVAIWDSGFDTSLFPGRVWVNPHPGSDDPHGIAFDVFSRPTHGPLIPLTSQQQADYSSMVADLQAMKDLQNGIQSDAASAIQKKLSAMPPAKMREYLDEISIIDGYAHGTHVTGIAAEGNPAIRLAYARMTYDNNNPHHPPTEEDAKANAAMSAQVVAWCKANHIRVVNMSFWDRPSNTEKDLRDNGIGKDEAERKQLAAHLFAIERDGMYNAIKSAPEILFVTIAGNSNANNAFEETMPSSFVLPNLIVAGAVDLAGDETSFTSYGKNVLVDADGYEVESLIPGGAKMKMSGTSMAAPQVTNLAAKLLALEPSLMPTQLIDLITKGADPTPDGRRHLMNPKASVSLLQSSTAVARR